MLKLTYEKGSNIFMSLAAQLPNRFCSAKAVCADAQLRQRVAAAKLANVTLVPPAADVSEVLVDSSLVIVPSILAEAFGLVVEDSMLRGLPVIVADAGALPEAAAGAAAAVLPVQDGAVPGGQTHSSSICRSQSNLSIHQRQQHEKWGQCCCPAERSPVQRFWVVVVVVVMLVRWQLRMTGKRLLASTRCKCSLS